MSHPAEQPTLQGSGWTVECTFDYYPGRPGVHTLRNGDPGYPDEPAELELLTATLRRPGLPDVPLHEYGTFLDDSGLLERWEEQIMDEWGQKLADENAAARSEQRTRDDDA